MCKIGRWEYQKGEAMLLSEYDEQDSLLSEIDCMCGHERQRVDKQSNIVRNRGGGDDHIRRRRQRARSPELCQPSRTKVTVGNSDNPGEAIGKADICFVVDESGSMTQEHDWLNTTIQQLDNALRAKRIEVRYCLVGYGTSNRLLGEFLVKGGADDIIKVVADLTNTGQLEDGYSAMYKVFNNSGNFTFDRDAKKVIILISDENRDDLDHRLPDQINLNYDNMLKYFIDNDVTLNVVVNQYFKDIIINTLTDLDEYVLGMDYQNQSYSQAVESSSSRRYSIGEPGNAYAVEDGGHESTLEDYVKLALQTNGSAWDLQQLKDASKEQVEAFIDAFVDVKVEEIAPNQTVCRVCECPDQRGQPVCTLNKTVPLDQCTNVCIIDGMKVPEGEREYKYITPTHSGVSKRSDANNKHFPQAVEIIFVIDESGSMEGDQSWFTRDFINRTNTLLKDRYGIGMSKPNKFGLLVFASYNRKPDDMGKLIVERVVAEEFSYIEFHHNGKIEDGYEAIKIAARELKEHNDAKKLIVLVTDEDRDNANATLTKELLKNTLIDNNISLDVVVNNVFESADGREAVGVGPSGEEYPAFILHHGDDPLPTKGQSVKDSAHGTTLYDYVEMAWNLCGVAWDINMVKRLEQPGQGENFEMDFAEYFSKRIHDVRCLIQPSEPKSCAWWSCRSAFPLHACQGMISDDNIEDITKETCASGMYDLEFETCTTLPPTTIPMPQIPNTPTGNSFTVDELNFAEPTTQEFDVRNLLQGPAELLQVVPDDPINTRKESQPHGQNRNPEWNKVCAKGAVELSSTSKLSFRKDIFQRSRKHVVTFCFKTTNSDGVLLWMRQRLPEPAHILIQVKSEKVQARVDLGSGNEVEVLTHDLVVSDGQWHKVMFRRKGNRIELRLDGNRRPKLIAGERYDRSLTFEANNKWYLGMANTDNISDVAAPLTGCISNVRVNKKKIKLQAEAIEKVDVFTCESSP
ncbi:uncharacterized protein LOC134181891 isoform X2 [Corticium candelabrum]|uniref:uncharacterized protein LOC134181891 isoform X2 n=1 Tax=Corticium candelabrum TaxID=121492 RepID=UPI002E259694|nr:uncharacterized protein LOC134181891 isoform X2 [Corticium candelabrum]